MSSRARTVPTRELVIVAAVALAITAVMTLTTDLRTMDHPRFADPADHRKYIYLATHDPFSLNLAPFGWRLLVPTLARILPFDLQTSFLVIAVASVWLTGVGVHVLARSFGFGSVLSASGMLMYFSLGWATKFNLHDFWLTDPVAFLAITWGMVLAVRRRDAALGALMAVGVLAKESVIFVAPLRYSFHARRLWDRSEAFRALVVALPGVAILVALRLAIPAMNDDPAYVRTLPPGLFATEPYGDGLTYDLLARAEWVLRYRARHFDLSQLYASTAAAFGLLIVVLPFFGGRRSLGLAVRFLPFLVLVWIQLLFAPVDTHRVLAVAFPALIVLALAGAEGICARWNVPPWAFLVVAGAFLVPILFTSRITLSLVQQVVLLVTSAAFLALAARWDARRRRPVCRV